MAGRRAAGSQVAVPPARSRSRTPLAAARGLGSFDRGARWLRDAPKFPPSMVLEFLLRHHARTGSRRAALEMVDATCAAMARGGMYDQLGGGFARYSVDAGWVVPHFEKMLYDNALLLGRLRAVVAPDRQPARRAGGARDRRLPAPRASAHRRADSPRRSTPTPRVSRGSSTSSPPADLARALPEPDVAWAADLLAVTDRRHLRARHLDPAAAPRPRRSSPLGPGPRGSLRLPGGRTRPARDDKVVAAWNGLAIASLAEAGMLLHEARYVDAARAAADLLLSVHLDDGRLGARLAGRGRGRAAGVLEDYGCVAGGLLALGQATGEVRGCGPAGGLLDTPSGTSGRRTGASSTPPTTRGAGGPPPGPGRQRVALGAVRDRRTRSRPTPR